MSTSIRVVIFAITANLLCSGVALCSSVAQARPATATRNHRPRLSPPFVSPQRTNQQERRSSSTGTPTRTRAWAVLVPETTVIARITDGTQATAPPSFIGRVRNYIYPEEWRGLSKKEILSRMGGPMVVSFSVIKQVVNAFSFPLGWYIHCSRTGLSPFAPGQWKLFLAINAGFRAVDAASTPIQLALAASASPLFRRMMDACKTRLRMNGGLALFTVSLFANVAAMGALVGNVVLVSLFTGVPIFQGR